MEYVQCPVCGRDDKLIHVIDEATDEISVRCYNHSCCPFEDNYLEAVRKNSPEALGKIEKRSTDQYRFGPRGWQSTFAYWDHSAPPSEYEKYRNDTIEYYKQREEAH